jgi:predicted transcriptional regulator
MPARPEEAASDPNGLRGRPALGGRRVSAEGAKRKRRIEKMNVGQICTRLPETTHRDTSVLDAARQMAAQEVGTLVVTDTGGRPDGIVTDRDIVVRCLAEGMPVQDTKVWEIMTRDPHTVWEDTAVEAALETMADKEIRRLVVVDQSERVVGIVALDDFLEGIMAASEDVGRLLRRQVHV